MDSTTSQRQTPGGGAPPAIHKARWVAVCRWLYSDPAFEVFRSRRPRRGLVGALLLVLAAFPVVGWVTDQTWAVMLVLIPFAAASLLVGAATQGLLDHPLGSLDERQVHVRRTIFREPYMTGAALGLAGGLTIAVATRVDEGLGMGLVLVALGVVMGVPSMVLAWTMPDEDDD